MSELIFFTNNILLKNIKYILVINAFWHFKIFLHNNSFWKTKCDVIRNKIE